ncbi:cupin domain-containing protein [Methylocystis bryophila]|uniref:Cupin n=1 Tax=Methylocystis bryophila TaxID=655015 RepID=A0A1W6MXD2_9HYPH|nr:cupin domain-containing protein [Methylocystis bryophila]ARN82196.1 cupin [Methylocystis bryophila]BDV38328.1 cupin [Methylocystis bryophila]
MSDVELFKGEQVQWRPAPINPAWVIEGAPETRNFLVSQSLDRSSYTFMWDCTAGVFNWYYDIDETVYILEGSVTIRDDNGVERTLVAGDHALFRAGSHAVWRVDKYVRKVAFLRQPVPQPLMFAVRAIRKLARMMNLGPATAASWG